MAVLPMQIPNFPDFSGLIKHLLGIIPICKQANKPVDQNDTTNQKKAPKKTAQTD
jgi:hypothetical protein